ncbi:hypothetical protein V8E54_010265 [Elaphomyces granulatus]
MTALVDPTRMTAILAGSMKGTGGKQFKVLLSFFNKCTADRQNQKSKTGEKNDGPVIRGTNIPMFRVNNHRDLPEAFRTLDFYIALCHRLMKQRMHLAEETDSWSLAEMQWILDLYAFAQKSISSWLSYHSLASHKATVILFAEVEFSKETPGAFGDCVIGEAENLTKNEGAVLQPLTRSWNYPLWIRLRVSEFPGAGLHLDEKNGGHEDMDLPKHQQG